MCIYNKAKRNVYESFQTFSPVKTFICDKKFLPSECSFKILSNSHSEKNNGVTCDFCISLVCVRLSLMLYLRFFCQWFAICLLFRSTFREKGWSTLTVNPWTPRWLGLIERSLCSSVHTCFYRFLFVSPT